MQKMLRRHISCCSFSWGRNFRFPNRRKLNNTVSGLRQLFAAAEKPLKIIDQFSKSKPLVCKLVVCSDPKEDQNLLTPEDSELADPLWGAEKCLCFSRPTSGKPVMSVCLRLAAMLSLLRIASHHIFPSGKPILLPLD